MTKLSCIESRKAILRFELALVEGNLEDVDLQIGDSFILADMWQEVQSAQEQEQIELLELRAEENENNLGIPEVMEFSERLFGEAGIKFNPNLVLQILRRAKLVFDEQE